VRKTSSRLAIAAISIAVAAPIPAAHADQASVRIHDIQGRAHLSPLAGTQVGDVSGVVTAVTGTGFWLQDPQPDNDPATSEGIFVFTKSKPTVTVGDAVTIAGKVSEYRPGGTASTNLTTTEIDTPTVAVSAHGVALPAPTVVHPPGKVIEDDATGDAEQSGTFDPQHDGLDYWESLEGMRVAIDDAQVVGPRNSYGEIPVVTKGASIRTVRGGIVARRNDFNPERVILDDVLAKTPAVDVGDRLPGRTVGVLDYSFGSPKLLVTATPQVKAGNLPRQSARPAGKGELAVATANVQNLAPNDPASKYSGLAAEIVQHLASPDLINVEEVQDNSGAKDDGTVAADQTVAKLTAAIKAAGGPSYEWRSIDPENDKDGGQPGGNIRVGFLFRTDRGLAFVDRPGGTATNATAVEDGQLTYSPGRIDPTNPAWTSSRKPLAGEFTWHGQRLIVVADHWNSKGGDDPLYGRFQPPRLPSEAQRSAQADAVAKFVRSAGKKANIIVAGDLNAFDFSTQVKTLTATGLRDLPATLPIAQRYTYVYEGNSEVLDHILLSPALARQPYSYQVVHVNAEYAVQASDHDPAVVRLRLK
jgi:predicted extracellular nuclease